MFPNRIKRVEREVQRTLADILRELKDPRLEGITITGVEISKDLRQGRVLISALRTETLPGALTALESAAGVIGRLLGQELDLRRIPRFTFLHDPSLAHGAKIDALLASVLPAEQELSAATGSDTIPESEA